MDEEKNLERKAEDVGKVVGGALRKGFSITKAFFKGFAKGVKEGGQKGEEVQQVHEEPKQA